jgi:hypothetical protein
MVSWCIKNIMHMDIKMIYMQEQGIMVLGSHGPTCLMDYQHDIGKLMDLQIEVEVLEMI